MVIRITSEVDLTSLRKEITHRYVAILAIIVQFKSYLKAIKCDFIPSKSDVFHIVIILAIKTN